MKKSLLVSSTIVAVALTGCMTIDQVTLSAKPASPQLRAQIVDAARDVLFDPYSVRDAEISYLADLPGDTDAVCVKLNAKNRLGGYTGRQVHAVYVRSGRPINTGSNPHLCNNPNLKWTKFPEIEAL